MERNVYIIGGTGFLGARVCRELHAAGYRVHAVIRETSDTSAIDEWVTRFMVCDMGDPAAAERLAGDMRGKGIGMVFLAGSVNYRHDYRRSRESNVATTEQIVRLSLMLQEKKILGRLVYTGSIASRGFPGPGEGRPLLSESADYYRPGVSVYCDVKHEAEAMVRRAMKERGLNGVIVEPGSLVGPSMGGRGTTNISLIKKILRGFPVLSGGASYTSADRAAAGIVMALEKGVNGEIYTLGGENMTMRDFARLVRQTAHILYPGRFTRIMPLMAVPRGAAMFMGSLGAVMNRQEALLGSSYHYIDWSLAEEKLGYRHSRGDLDAAVRETIEEIAGSAVL